MKGIKSQNVDSYRDIIATLPTAAIRSKFTILPNNHVRIWNGEKATDFHVSGDGHRLFVSGTKILAVRSALNSIGGSRWAGTRKQPSFRFGMGFR